MDKLIKSATKPFCNNYWRELKFNRGEKDIDMIRFCVFSGCNYCDFELRHFRDENNDEIFEENNDEINGDIEYLYDDIYCVTSKYFENNQEKVIKHHDHEKFCKNNNEKLKNLSSEEYCLFEKMQYIECNDNKEIYNYIKLVNEIIRLMVKYIIKKDDKQLKLINIYVKILYFLKKMYYNLIFMMR